MIHKNRFNRRKTNYKKAARKQRLVHECYPNIEEYYEHYGQYIKGKIHCSCPLCAAKTNRRKGLGAYKRYGKNYTRQDMRSIDRLYDTMEFSEEAEPVVAS